MSFARFCDDESCEIEQVAVTVEDDHRLGLEPLDTRRDELPNTAHLLGRELLPEVQVQRDRRRRRLLLLLEHRVLAEREVDARRLDLRERRDAARQLALQRAAIVDLLGEARLPEVVAVEQLEALARERQAGARRDRARLIEIAIAHLDLALAQPRRQAARVERRVQLLRVVGRQAVDRRAPRLDVMTDRRPRDAADDGEHHRDRGELAAFGLAAPQIAELTHDLQRVAGG